MPRLPSINAHEKWSGHTTVGLMEHGNGGNGGAVVAGSAASLGEFGAATLGEFGAATLGEFGAASLGEFGAASLGEFGMASLGEFGMASGLFGAGGGSDSRSWHRCA